MALTLGQIKRPKRPKTKKASQTKKSKPLAPFQTDESLSNNGLSDEDIELGKNTTTPSESHSDPVLNANKAPTLDTKKSRIDVSKRSLKKANEERKQYVNNTDTDVKRYQQEKPDKEHEIQSKNSKIQSNDEDSLRKQSVNSKSEQEECLRKQSVNKTVAKKSIKDADSTDYVNSAYTERKQDHSPAHIDYVNNTETSSSEFIESNEEHFFKADKQGINNEHENYVNSTYTERKQPEVTQKDSKQSENSTGTVEIPVRIQSVNNTYTNRKQINVHVLGKGERQVLQFLHSMAVKNGGTVTPEVRYPQIAEFAGIKTAKSAKTYVQRLVKRGFIERVAFTKGPSAWTKIKIDQQVHEKLLLYGMQSGFDSSTETVRKQNENSAVTQEATRADTVASSKLVSNNKLLTNKINIDEIDMQNLEEQGVSKKQLQDIINQKLEFTQSTLQEFVSKFAEYISEPNNVYNVKNMRGLFVSMAQAQSRGQEPLAMIQTEAEAHINAIIEKRKRAHEKKEEAIERLIAVEFESWMNDKSKQECTAIVPEQPYVEFESETYKRLLRSYFVENVWPALKDRLLSGIDI